MSSIKMFILISVLFFMSMANLDAKEIQSSKFNLTQQETLYLHNKKVINMCIDPNWMPFEKFDKDGKYIGISADFFKIFQDKIGTKINVIKTKSWSQSIEFAKSRKCDILSLAMQTPDRKKYMNFTKPYLSIPLVVATKTDVRFIPDFLQLKDNKTVGMVKGYAISELLRNKYQNMTIVDVESVDDGLAQVVDGKIFGFIGSLSTIGYKFQTKFTGQLKIAGQLDEKWELGVGVRNDDRTLLNIFEKLVNNLDESKKQTIITKWLSIEKNQIVDYEYLWAVISFFIIILLISVFWMLKLSKANKIVARTLLEAEKISDDLEKQKDYFEYFFHNTIETVGIFKEGICITINEAGVKLFGLEYVDDAIGLSALSFMAPDSHAIVIKNMSADYLLPYEVNAIKQDGTIFPALVKGYTKVMDGANVRITSLLDLSELKNKESKIQEQKEVFERLFFDVSDAVLIIEEGRFSQCNDAIVKILKYDTKEEVLNLHPSQLSPEFQPDGQKSEDKADKMMNLCFENGSNSFEWVHLRSDGEEFWCDISLTKITIAGKDIIHVLWRDISKAKGLEEHLIEARNRAQQANKSKSEFLANMSHEIRTPMNGIMGMTTLALQTNLTSQQKNYISQIDGSAKSLLNIINDILDFSKMEAGKLTIEKVDFNMHDILSQIKSMMEFKAKEKNLDFSLSCEHQADTIFYGDSLRISQVLINLVSNATKFTNRGFVKVYISRAQNNRVKFEISDSGIGISKENQKKLFEAFSQADGSTSRKYGGTGLGLSISKQLVELMQGTISVESELGKGSKFVFEIPLQMGDKNNIITDEKIDKNSILSLKDSNILLVEDNKTNQEIIIGLLEGSGIIIDIAKNGKEAVAMFNLNENRYELILMDLQMPIMDGYEATKIIRKRDKNIPIVALTANAMKEDVERTQKAGMNEHLNKPIEVEKLYKALLKYISQKGDPQQNTIIVDDTELPEFQYIEIEKGLKHLAGNKKLYLKILDNFKNDYADFRVDTLSEEDFKRAIHTLKGLSANIGASQLQLKVKELDETQDISLLGGVYKELKNVLEDLKVLPEIRIATSQELLELSSDKRDELFKQLSEFAQKSRANKCKKIVQELQTYQLEDEDKQVVQRVQELIGKYKYKDVLWVLSSFI